MDLAVFALSKLHLIQGAIDIKKQVRQNEEKRIYEPQPLMHLSPHFLASFTVYSWLANYEFIWKQIQRKDFFPIGVNSLLVLK